MKLRKEKDVIMLEDMCLVDALLIMTLSLVFLLDILQREWMLWIIMGLGLIMNLMIAACGLLREKKLISVVALLLFFAMAGVTVFLIVES